MVEAGGERKTAVDRDEPVRRLEADDAAAGGGDADRAAGVGSQGRVGEPGRVEQVLDGQRDPLARPLGPGEEDPLRRLAQWIVG